MYKFLLILFLLVAVILITLIILQQNKDMYPFSVSTPSTVFHSNSSNDFIVRMTVILIIFFFILSLILSNINSKYNKKNNKWNDLNKIQQIDKKPVKSIKENKDIPV